MIQNLDKIRGGISTGVMIKKISIEKSIEIIPEDDPFRLLVRDCMTTVIKRDSYPEDYDFSIHPNRGTFSERHKDLVKLINLGLETGQYKTNRSYSLNEIYQIINEEHERRQTNLK